jgi:hypothetical protein
MDRIIYSKYSNDRADRFKIRTDICKNGQGEWSVRKHPLCKAAISHVTNIYKIYEALQEKYCDMDIQINRCWLDDEDAVFEYIKGNSLEEYLDTLLVKDTSKKEFYLVLDKYIAMVKKNTEGVLFEQSDAFEDVFGKIDMPERLEASSLSNIDMLFENLLVADKLTMIDYEWTFSFKIPVNYVLYRAFAAYTCGLYEGVDRRITLEELCAYCHISEAEIRIYEEMSHNFAAYVMSGKKTMKDIHGCIGQMVYNPQDMIREAEEDCTRRSIQILPDFGNGYSEQDSYFIQHSQQEGSAFHVIINCDKKYKAVRIDPAIDTCICSITLISCDGKPCEYTTNGTMLENGTIVFNTEDPQIYIQNISEVESIQMMGELYFISKEMASSCEMTISSGLKEINSLNEELVTINQYAEKNKQESDQIIQEYLQIIEDRGTKINELETCVAEKSSTCSALEMERNELQQTIDNMKQTKAWKLYEKYRKISGKE